MFPPAAQAHTSGAAIPPDTDLSGPIATRTNVCVRRTRLDEALATVARVGPLADVQAPAAIATTMLMEARPIAAVMIVSNSSPMRAMMISGVGCVVGSCEGTLG